MRLDSIINIVQLYWTSRHNVWQLILAFPSSVHETVKTTGWKRCISQQLTVICKMLSFTVLLCLYDSGVAHVSEWGPFWHSYNNTSIIELRAESKHSSGSTDCYWSESLQYSAITVMNITIEQHVHFSWLRFIEAFNSDHCHCPMNHRKSFSFEGNCM